MNFVDPSGMLAKEVGIVVISIHPSYDVGGALGGAALYVKGAYEGNEEYKKYGLEGALVSLSGLVKPLKKVKKAGEVIGKISGKIPYKGNKPKFENDNGTILKNKDKFQKTNYRVQGASVYKDNKGNHYYRDQEHLDHLEVFNKKGNHLGEADPLTGNIIPGTIDKNKIFKP